MSIFDNIKGMRSGNDEEFTGGVFNPFKILEIGETMVRYVDGIRIKDFTFFAVLTSERLVLIDSAKQGAGVIAKEIPAPVIKSADLERDERDRPSLALNMEISGQHRVMRLVFTGQMEEPETECREWFTAINGYPPQPPEKENFDTISPPIDVAEVSGSTPIPPEISPETVPLQVPEPETTKVTVSSEPEIIQPQQPPQIVPPSSITEKKVPSPPVKKKEAPIKVRPAPSAKQEDGSVRIVIEKPDLSPIMVTPHLSSSHQAQKYSRYCIYCGARIPASSRFCQTCGKQQS